MLEELVIENVLSKCPKCQIYCMQGNGYPGLFEYCTATAVTPGRRRANAKITGRTASDEQPKSLVWGKANLKVRVLYCCETSYITTPT